MERTPKSIRGMLEHLRINLRELHRVEIYQWTEEQIQFLKDNYKTMFDKDIALKLFNDSSPQAVCRILRKRKALGLEKEPRGLKYRNNNAEYKSRFYKGEIIFEHRENAEKKLGRKLKEEEIVHHIDGNKKNNSFDNLYVCKDKKQHQTLHSELEKIARKLVERKIILFDEEKGQYFIDENKLI